MKKIHYILLALYLKVSVLMIYTLYQGQQTRENVQVIKEVLIEEETIKKANTADTVNKIELQIFKVIDYRLDRIDSTLNLPY